jgi:hypothetical protein
VLFKARGAKSVVELLLVREVDEHLIDAAVNAPAAATAMVAIAHSLLAVLSFLSNQLKKFEIQEDGFGEGMGRAKNGRKEVSRLLIPQNPTPIQ